MLEPSEPGEAPAGQEDCPGVGEADATGWIVPLRPPQLANSEEEQHIRAEIDTHSTLTCEPEHPDVVVLLEPLEQ